MRQYQRFPEVCENVAVGDNPTGWPAQLTGQIAAAISATRAAQGMSVLRLAGRTGELGYPMHRTAIAKIESGDRVVTVAELIALAAALGTTPMALLFADTEATVEVLPGIDVTGADAAGWFAGSETWLLDVVADLNDVDQQLDIQRRNLFQVESGLEKLDMPEGLKDHQRQRLGHIRELIKSLEQQRESIIRGDDGG
jgi:transcriptional regulator with XRE-family HTH domain